jgi:hypothetical protein
LLKIFPTLTIKTVCKAAYGYAEGIEVTDPVNKISGAAVISGNGGSNNRKKEASKRAKQDDHDTVSISDEARRLRSMEEPEDQTPRNNT